MEYLFDIGVTIILSELKKSVNNADRKRKLKNIMLKIYTKIKELYSEDSDFN